MALTKKQKEIADFLESLVGQRFNMETLTKELSKAFDEEIEAEIVNDDDETNTLTDWNIMFNSEKEDTFGYFDIYVLKMRNANLDGSTFYVTEVGYEFE
jgi:hypothetical protein